MSTTPQPAPSQADHAVHDVVALLLASMQMAAFEPLPNGPFRLISTPPEWLRDLVPGIESAPEADLVERFPLLETFLPEAQEAWQATGSGRPCSEIWAEAHPGGDDTHLQAWAFNLAGRPILVMDG